MFTTNPFFVLTESVSPIFMQLFVILMIALIVVGTVMDLSIKKMLNTFLTMQKRQKKTQLKSCPRVKE